MRPIPVSPFRAQAATPFPRLSLGPGLSYTDGFLPSQISVSTYCAPLARERAVNKQGVLQTHSLQAPHRGLGWGPCHPQGTRFPGPSVPHPRP